MKNSMRTMETSMETKETSMGNIEKAVGSINRRMDNTEAFRRIYAILKPATESVSKNQVFLNCT